MRGAPGTRATRADRAAIVERVRDADPGIPAAGSDARVSNIDDQGRPEPPIAADEWHTLVGFLDFLRATFEWKVRGLGRDGLSARTAASTMTLGGLMKHLAYVEQHWFSWRLHGREWGEPWRSVDWQVEPDWEWTSSLEDAPDELWAIWRRSVEDARADAASALASGGLDGLCVRPWPNGESPSLRWVLVHMIEEYARHNGHADLLRESIDGETGE